MRGVAGCTATLFMKSLATYRLCAQAGEIWLYTPFLCACYGPAVGFGSHVLRLGCDDHPTLMRDGELHLEVFLVSLSFVLVVCVYLPRYRAQCWRWNVMMSTTPRVAQGVNSVCAASARLDILRVRATSRLMNMRTIKKLLQ